MVPKPRLVPIVVAALLSVLVGAAADAATTLLVPQSTAFSVLGHSCGGIQEQVLATGFDAVSGFPTGNVYLQTRCGGSGRGGGYHTTTYSKWLGVTWDYTGAVVSFAVLAAPPASIDPTFSAFDGFGNEIYEQLNATNVTPAACSVGNTTYCSYRAYLALAGTFAPPPRITSLSVASGPASGGTVVNITGTGFTGAQSVDFGATPAAGFTVNGDTSITATAPAAGGGTVDVIVTTAGGASAAGASDQFTFVAAPAVTGIDPNSGPLSGGTLVTITGVNLVAVTAVDFGETPAGFTVNDDGSITAVSPPGEALDTVAITVVTLGGTSPANAAGEFTYTAAGPTSSCGDGTVDPTEQCDDGAANGQPGDCCTITCQFVAAGTSCADEGDLCTADACDGAGACAHAIAPSLACTPPDLSRGASVLMRTTRSGHHEMQFTWGKGPVVSPTDFGDPTAGDRLELCVYEQSGASDYTLAFSGAPSTGGDGAWSRRSTGWQYRSTSGAPDGITHVVLKAGAVPLKALLQVTAMKSPSIGPLPVPPGTTVVAQLKSSLGACWGATFSAPSVNGARELKAKSD